MTLNNKITIDLNQLIKLGIAVEGWLVLWALANNKEAIIGQYTAKCCKLVTENLDKLVELEYIVAEQSVEGKYLLSKMSLTDKGKSLFPINSVVDASEWIDVWYELWPKGVKSGSFYVKTGKEDCLKKLIKFQTNHPQYTKGIIITATKKYLDASRMKGWDYCKLAPYFIYKDGLSMLEGFCAEVLNNVSKDTKTSKIVGNIERI